MQVYKKILVAIDCSPVDDAIIEHISALAIQNNAGVHLMHVVHSHTLDQERALHEDARKCMDGYRQKLKDKGINACIIIKSGEPDAELLKEIEGKGYDLMAMATHGHTIIGDILFGSVSDTLKHKISIPLLLIKSERRA